MRSEITPAVENDELIIRIPDRTDHTSNGIHASNEASPVRLAVWAFLVLALAATIITYAIHHMTGWSIPATSVIGVAFFLLTGFLALLVLNGDFPAIYNVRSIERTERTRITASERTFERYYDYKGAEEEHRHIERMATIQHDSAVTRLQNDVAAVHDAVSRLLTHRGMETPTKAGNYVPARPRPALVAAQQWVLDLYDTETGKPNTSMVHANGTLKRAAPWRKRGGEWMREEWGVEAAEYVLRPIGQEPPFILPIVADGKPRGYRLNVEKYPTLGRAQRTLVVIA